MRITNNYKNINLKDFSKRFFSKQKNTLLTIFALQLLVLLATVMNFYNIYKLGKYLKSIEISDLSI